MKKHFRKLALAAVFAMAVSMIAPAAKAAEAATTKTFTYAEQVTGDAVTTLVMDKGEKVDLKFIGVSNWRTYTYKWASSNTKVATVDSAGIITAVGTGVATITLKISGGDGTQYKSTGVTVYVDLNQEVTIGTSSQDEIKSYTMSVNDSATLKVGGLKDNVGKRYTATWTSTDTSVAKIDENGKITPVAPGLTVIQLSVKKVFNNKTMTAAPIALLVTEADGSVSATATPAPTKKPNATATPTPTRKPNATATPTPTPTVTPVPSDEYVSYTATLEADNCLLLKFSKAVDYDISDVALYESINAGSQTVEIKRDILSATLSNGGTELRIVPSTAFSNGDKYVVKAGSADTGKTVNVVLGAPNRLEVTYECLGTSGKAYAYDEDLAIDVPVTLSYRLYYGNIDVTESYKNNGYITYTNLTTKYEDYIDIAGDVLNFYKSGISVTLTAEYTYWNDTTEKTIKNTFNIASQKLPTYAIKTVPKWTIIDTTKTDKIDWNNTVHEVICYNENAKLVVMVADTYGNYYVTDERGVDTENNIYYVDDYDSLFAKFGYSIELAAADDNYVSILEDGTMFPYQSTSETSILVNLVDSGNNSGKYSNKTISVCQMKILAESKLSTIAAESAKVTLASQAISGFESRFCETDVEILLKDQYGSEWNGDYALELSSTNKNINNALNSSKAPATLNGTTLHISAEYIKDAIGTNGTTAVFDVTETTTNKTARITVALQKPAIVNGSITVGGWKLAIDKASVKLGEIDASTFTQSVKVEALKTSNSVSVGLYNDLTILTSNDYKFTNANCSVDQVYVLVLGPDDKPVAQAADANSVGVYADTVNGCVQINITAPKNSGGLTLESLSAGKYTVKVTRITSTSGSTPGKVTLTTGFTVEDSTKTVAYRSMKSTKTSLTVSNKNDLEGVKAIVAELFTFSLDGKEWTDFTADCIADAEFTVQKNGIFIKSVDLSVPIEVINGLTMTYTKNVVLNKTIKTGVTN